MRSKECPLFITCFVNCVLLSEFQILHQFFLRFGFGFALLCKLNLVVDGDIIDLEVTVGDAHPLNEVGAGDDLLV